jgi:hypothetical protein
VTTRFLLGICNGILGTVRVCINISTKIYLQLNIEILSFYAVDSHILQCEKSGSIFSLYSFSDWIMIMSEEVIELFSQAYASELCSKEHQALGLSTVTLMTTSSYRFSFVYVQNF